MQMQKEVKSYPKQPSCKKCVACHATAMHLTSSDHLKLLAAK